MPPISACATNAAEYGFLPSASGLANRAALQTAVDRGGTIVVTEPGTYALAGTVYVGSHTTLSFGAGVFVHKVDEVGAFSHVLLNKGALTKSYDEAITIDGLHVIVNGMDVRTFADVFGLHGQIAFFYVRDLCVKGFRCLDLGRAQYGIHICTFEDIRIEDVIIHGGKDGVHLGRGKRFTIRDGVFRTGDDAVALNAHDYDVGNPELGWIENGVVENCHDLREEREIGFFCRILGGAWSDWRPGMEVQKSDTVVHNGRLYRVRAEMDGRRFVSENPPTHESGAQTVDRILWQVVQDDVTYTCGVRNVVFRDIYLENPRTGFSVHFDNDKYSRSYYPGSEVPHQENIVLDHIVVMHDRPSDLVSVNTPVDSITITNSRLRNSSLKFHSNDAVSDLGPTKISLVGCVFAHRGTLDLIKCSVPGKRLSLATTASTVLHDEFRACVAVIDTPVALSSDLPGLAE